jgi:hypothetical protein
MGKHGCVQPAVRMLDAEIVIERGDSSTVLDSLIFVSYRAGDRRRCRIT